MSFAVPDRAARAARPAARRARPVGRARPPPPLRAALPRRRRPSPRVLPHSPAWRRWLPTALLGARRGGARARARQARAHRRRPDPAGVASCSSATRPARWPRPTSSRPAWTPRARPRKTFLDKVPKSLRVGLVGYSTFPHTVLRPTLDRDDARDDARRPRRRRRHRDRRRARQRARDAAARRTRRPSARRRRSSCCPTARRPTGRTRSRSPARRRS